MRSYGVATGRWADSLVRSPLDKIKHVVIVVQENRSLNDLFYGFPGAKTAKYGYDSKNQKIPLQPIGFATNGTSNTAPKVLWRRVTAPERSPAPIAR